ncbi:18452_t:CDS:1, partial [Gigaspora rosea]
MFLGQNAALPIYDDQESILPNNDVEITDLLDENSFQNEEDWQRQVD